MKQETANLKRENKLLKAAIESSKGTSQNSYSIEHIVVNGIPRHEAHKGKLPRLTSHAPCICNCIKLYFSSVVILNSIFPVNLIAYSCILVRDKPSGVSWSFARSPASKDSLAMIFTHW